MDMTDQGNFYELVLTQEDREKKRFEKAEKLTEEQYGDDPVWWDARGPADGLFVSVEDVREYCEENEVELPEYVWACDAEKFHIDMQGAVEDALERQELYEGAYDDLGGDEAIKELQALVQGWLDKHPVISWRPHYKRAVLLDR